MFFAGLIDFLFDPRMPQYLPGAKLKQMTRRKLTKRELPQGLPVLLALTFDIESDFGSSAKEITFDAVEPFLVKLPEFTQELGAVVTLFIQGELVAKLARYFRELQSKHELGLHGYAHELWGRTKWFLPHHPVPLNTKRELLRRSINCFLDNGLIAPTSFRAPDLVIDRETLKLLEESGFTVDSSAPSYYGALPIPTKPLGATSQLLSIPVTANPIPLFQIRYFLPFTFYEVFNLARLATTDDEHFLNYVREVLAFQVGAGVKPHLVFLAHPWEFREWSDRRGLAYCSEYNFELLSRKFSLLEGRYRLQYVSMNGLSRLLSVG